MGGRARPRLLPPGDAVWGACVRVCMCLCGGRRARRGYGPGWHSGRVPRRGQGCGRPFVHLLQAGVPRHHVEAPPRAGRDLIGRFVEKPSLASPDWSVISSNLETSALWKWLYIILHLKGVNEQDESFLKNSISLKYHSHKDRIIVTTRLIKLIKDEGWSSGKTNVCKVEDVLRLLLKRALK